MIRLATAVAQKPEFIEDGPFPDQPVTITELTPEDEAYIRTGTRAA